MRNRVLILAPLGADAANMRAVLEDAEIRAEVCAGVDDLAQHVEEGCGVLLLTEEAITGSTSTHFSRALVNQPAWSDVPIIMITSGGNSTGISSGAVRLLGPRAAVSLIERPLRKATLVSTVQAGLRARARQYDIRDLLAERDRLLTSLEERVVERTIRLQQVIEELEAFSYSVSHDLRAPLRALTGYSEALLLDCKENLNTTSTQYAERIFKAATSLDRLTRDLLIYTRVARQGISLEDVNLDTVLDEVLDQYPTINESRDRIKIEGPLGHVVAHPPSVIQCFSNLLENGIKFAKPGEKPEIVVSARTEGERLRVSFKDAGIGIAPENQAKVFGMFERLGDGATVGTGIGLAIVKKAVERMGGVVGVTSTPGDGACFWIEFDTASTRPL